MTENEKIKTMRVPESLHKIIAQEKLDRGGNLNDALARLLKAENNKNKEGK